MRANTICAGMTKIIPKKKQLRTLLLSSKLTISMIAIPAITYFLIKQVKIACFCPYCVSTIA